MNYHDNKWILSQVFDHYKEATQIIPEKRIVVVALQGSQNYGLDTENSDIDTKCIITPTFREIALVKQPTSTTHIRANNEHIDLKDIRLYIQTFRKQNLNFLEILYTPYYLVGCDNTIKQQWKRLIENREAITHYDSVRSVKSMLGIASEKYFALEHHYPSRMEWINKFGYDPKQLCHLLRIADFLQKYIRDENYEDCLHATFPQYLKDVKTGIHPLDEARKIAAETYSNIHEICDIYVEKHKNDPVDKYIDELLDDVSYEIMRAAIHDEVVS